MARTRLGGRGNGTPARRRGPWHDAASVEPLRRYWAVRALAELHETDGDPARAVGVLALSSRTSDVLFDMEAIYRRTASRATLRTALRAELERLRRGLADGSVPVDDAPEHLRRPESVRRAIARLWAVLGDPVPAWRELREQTGEIPKAARSPAPEDDHDDIDFRVVPLEEIALAARLAECHIDDRRRQAYRRDVARACLDQGDVAAAKTIQARIEDRGIADALAGEIERVGAGGAPTPPAGEVLAVVIDNDQPATRRSSNTSAAFTTTPMRWPGPNGGSAPRSNAIARALRRLPTPSARPGNGVVKMCASMVTASARRASPTSPPGPPRPRR